MKVIDSTNIDILNTYINLKKNNIPTDIFVRHAKQLQILETQEDKNIGYYGIYDKKIYYTHNCYKEVIKHELMHSATINYKVLKSKKNNRAIKGKISSARFILFGKTIGYALDEGIVELLTILTNLDSTEIYDYDPCYKKITSIAALLLSIANKQEFIDAYCSTNPIIFYKLLINKIGLTNLIKLVKTTDKYLDAIDTNNEEDIINLKNKLELLKLKLGEIIKQNNSSTHEIKLIRNYYRNNTK